MYYNDSVDPKMGFGLSCAQGKFLCQCSLSRIPSVPPDTEAVARAAFPKGNIYVLLRDNLGSIYSDVDFAALFSQRGQPAKSPWRLALISVMQFVENLSDRQAAEAVRSRIDWKYALSLPLTDAGFHFSIFQKLPVKLAESVVVARAQKYILVA